MKFIHKKVQKKIRKIKSSLKSRQGSYVPEAAITFSFSILVVITVVFIILFFYEQSLSQCQMHMALRSGAGEFKGITRYSSEFGNAVTPESYWNGEITYSGLTFQRTVSGSSRILMKHQGILTNIAQIPLNGVCHASSGTEFIRLKETLR